MKSSDSLDLSKLTTEGVRALLQAGADINSLRMADGYTLLMLASAPASDATLLQFLVAHGADVNAHDSRGTTALHQAVVGASLDKVQVLLNAGANPNLQHRDGTSPLHLAASRGYADV